MRASRFPLVALIGSLIGCATAPPEAETLLQDGNATAPLGKPARFSGLDVVPIRIEEDSRCPTGVQCIQAGTVRLLVRVEGGGATSEPTLTLGKPVALAGGGWLALAAACPYPRHPGRIASASYRFTLALRVEQPPNRLDLPCGG
jgi:hypothetical protein